MMQRFANVRLCFFAKRYTMLYLLSKYDAFVFGSKKKLYQKRVAHAVKIKALSKYLACARGLNF